MLYNVLKWTATVVLIIGTALNNLGMYPIGPIVSNFGTVIWVIISFIMREPSLIVVNIAMLLTGVGGLTYHYYPNLFQGLL